MTEPIEKIPLNKTLQFYFNPIEPIRMLRYFPFQTKFEKENMDFIHQEIYSQNQKINYGILIYLNSEITQDQIELQLHYIQNINHIDNILFFYTKNTLSNNILNLLNQYNVEQIEQPELLFNQKEIGDLNELDCLFQGLLWAKEKNIDILIKCDPTLIACYKWIDDFDQIVKNSDGLTFTSYGEEWETFRTELIGMNVKYWTNDTILYSIKWLLENQCTVFLSIWLHEISKILAGINYSEKFRQYLKDNMIDYIHSGYVFWYDILGINENTMDKRHKDVLYKTYSTIQDYKKYVDKL